MDLFPRIRKNLLQNYCSLKHVTFKAFSYLTVTIRCPSPVNYFRLLEVCLEHFISIQTSSFDVKSHKWIPNSIQYSTSPHFFYYFIAVELISLVCSEIHISSSHKFWLLMWINESDGIFPLSAEDISFIKVHVCSCVYSAKTSSCTITRLNYLNICHSIEVNNRNF